MCTMFRNNIQSQNRVVTESITESKRVAVSTKIINLSRGKYTFKTKSLGNVPSVTATPDYDWIMTIGHAYGCPLPRQFNLRSGNSPAVVTKFGKLQCVTSFPRSMLFIVLKIEQNDCDAQAQSQRVGGNFRAIPPKQSLLYNLWRLKIQ